MKTASDVSTVHILINIPGIEINELDSNFKELPLLLATVFVVWTIFVFFVEQSETFL